MAASTVDTHRMARTTGLALSVCGLLAVAGCGSADSSAVPTTPTTVAAPTTVEASTVDTSTTVVATAGVETTTVVTVLPETLPPVTAPPVTVPLADWQTLPLVDVDGVPFTLADFVGTPVLVENFATWCPNCRKQLGMTNDAADQLAGQAVVIALSVETELSAADIATYADDEGFGNIRFAVMTPEFLAAIADALGTSSINPPSTPHFVIDPTGVVGPLVTGFESADQIVAAVSASNG